MSAKKLRIAFAGTPEIASHILQAIIDRAEQDISLVLTQPDRPAGRGRKLKPSEVKACALEHSLPVMQPANKQELEQVALNDVDLLLVVAYGIVISADVINTPKLGSVNVHTSLLPRWRGAAPIQRSIEAGDQQTGISFMQMDAGLDTGPVISQHVCAIDSNETAGSLHDKLARLASENIHELLTSIANGDSQATPQTESLSCYARKISKAEAALDWNQPAKLLERKIRAFNPFPVCYTTLNGLAMRIWQATCKDYSGNLDVGQVINTDKHSIDVITSDGILAINKLQLPGKRPVTVADFLNSRPDFFHTA